MRTTISAAFQTVALPSVRAVGTLFGTLGVLSAASMLGALGATNALADTTVDPTDPAYRCDVLVVGAGGAGMSAAIVAREKGASVLILEKMPRAGGNTLLATGHITATGSNYQAENDIHAEAQRSKRTSSRRAAAKPTRSSCTTWSRTRAKRSTG